MRVLHIKCKFHRLFTSNAQATETLMFSDAFCSVYCFIYMTNKQLHLAA